MKKLTFLLMLFSLFFVSAGKVSADIYMVSSSSSFKKYNHIDYSLDPRVGRLEVFLDKYSSPLSDYAEVIIKESDENNLDWRLIPAITGVESTFGKQIPSNSYNAYGWDNGNYSFSSWNDSIQVVSETLNEKYYQKGATDINKIARRYAPPSNTWAYKVKYFMNKIDPLPVEFDI